MRLFFDHPLESNSLSKNLEKICCAAFNGCKNLKEIEIPQSVKFIDEWAFENCKKLKSITIPESVNRIDKKAFCSCESLEEINFVSSKKYFKGDFYNCKSLDFSKYQNNMEKNVD
ncbi:MAG: leucine-rich repeat domain-containing protein [Spirochaetales bacterium]|nr:leucine-rich repeat domain-containing protein [Spirochaetales bacterium]